MKQLSLDLPKLSGPLQEEIRGLSFWQPFGTLMLWGKHETRSWSTGYRGVVLICTTKTPYWNQPIKSRRHISFSNIHKKRIDYIEMEESEMQFPTHTLHGYAIGLGTLDHCRLSKPEDNSYYIHQPGIITHIYKDVKRIKPFAVKGGQGWFSVTPEMRSKIQVL